MLLLSLLKLNKRIQFALQILLLIIAAHALLLVIVYGGNKLLQRKTKQKISMSAIKPGARVVCMPMLAGTMRSKAGRAVHGIQSANVAAVSAANSPVNVTQSPVAPVATESNNSVRRVHACPSHAQKNKAQKVVQQKNKKGRKERKKILSKAEQKKIARQQALKEKAAKKKVAESKKVQPITKKVEQKIQPAVPVSKPVEQVLATPSTPSEMIPGAVIANAVSPVSAEATIGQEHSASAQAGTLLDEEVIVVSTAAEMQAVHALQEMVVGLQTVWHPPIGFKPKQPLLVEVVGDKHGKLSVVSIKQSSGVLAYDLQAKNAIAQIEPILGAADMRLVLEF